MPNNMGIVRYILAIAVFIAHFNVLTGSDFWFFISSFEGVGGFFALSGFLIYGSYLKRPNPKYYIKSRALRLLPAYAATVLIFAICLASVSSLSCYEYFSSGHFWKYLISNLSFMNFIEPTLPGVFDNMKISAVNGSLWTMKVEWMLYLSVPVTVWLIRKLNITTTKAFVGIYLFSVLYSYSAGWMYDMTGRQIWIIMGRQVFGQMAYFYSGALIYLWFDEFVKNKWLILIVGLLCYITSIYSSWAALLLRPLSFAILVVWLSMIGKWGTWEGKHDNVSYNIYLLHFPVIQLIIRSGIPDIIPSYAVFILSFFIVCILAIAIAKFIENPIRRIRMKP